MAMEEDDVVEGLVAGGAGWHPGGTQSLLLDLDNRSRHHSGGVLGLEQGPCP